MSISHSPTGWLCAIAGFAMAVSALGCANSKEHGAPPVGHPSATPSANSGRVKALDPARSPTSDGMLSVEAKVTSKHDGLVVNVTLQNRGATELLVLDRLWRISPKNQPVLDANVAYRFVRDHSLRLFFGRPPIPAGMMPQLDFLPDATRLAAGARITHTLVLHPPVTEYSVMFPERSPPATSPTPVRVETIAVIVHYARPEDCLHTKPSSIDPQAVYLGSYPMAVHSAYAEVRTPPFEAQRRNDEFERLKLAGE